MESLTLERDKLKIENEMLKEENKENITKIEKTERMVARLLLYRWVKKFAGGCKPGAWEYDHEAADLCQATADLLGIKDPWENC